MRSSAILSLTILLGATTPALAQRFPFERSIDVNGASVLDVSTIRGKIDVTAGTPGRIVVGGGVTVRIGFDVPANALELARKIADSPPIERDGKTIRLRPPSGSAEQRAVTVNYQVQVPPDTQVLALSDSGATTISGVSGAVTVRTQSAAIELNRIGGGTEVTTGSGTVMVDDAAGGLSVTTNSSAFTGRSLKGSVRVRTRSGAVDAGLSGGGNVDVETGSSAIRLHGLQGALTAATRSGHVSIQGGPAAPWSVTTGSGGVDIVMDSVPALSVNAVTGSGSVRIEGASVRGSISKREVTGDIGSGGPLVRVNTRSGSIEITVGSNPS